MATSSKNDIGYTTKRILDIQSLNQCAFPGCTNPLVEPGTGQSNPAVVSDICHIYASSPNGPRGQGGLTEEELKSIDNLILLCPNHHRMVDRQPETYTAELLKQWKEEHEAKVKSRHPDGLDIIRELVDEKIKNETDILRKSRFFAEFNSAQSSLGLARKLVEEELSIGTNAVRRHALAWCARILSTHKLDKAEEYLNHAKKLDTCEEIDIADAFISSQKGDKSTALSALTSIDSPMSLSAALIVVANHDGPQGAVDWLKTVGIDTADLAPEGKRFLLQCQLELNDWEAAQECLDVLTDVDMRDTPVLHHLVAITHLLSTVHAEFRSVVLRQLPLSAANFPLASSESAINARRTARSYFIESKKAACQLNLPRAAAIAEEYALWLELKDPDPDESDKGRMRLESKLHDLKSALRFVRLGIEFGIELKQDKVEREIEREIALNGEITLDAALARFALAFKQKSPEDVANYIDRHLNELTDHIDKKSMQLCQIEMFARAGLPDRVNGIWEKIKDGLSEAEKNRLRRIIAESEGVDPVKSRKAQFEETGSLRDLESLVSKLEDRDDWDGICEYGEILFNETLTSPNAERFARALHNTQQNKRLIEFLKSNEAFVAQSNYLQMLYCWSLYQEGELLETRSELAKLSDDWDNENYRKLQIYLAISLGNWNSLSAFVAKECQEKDKINAQELIRAAQLALQLNSPYVKDLIRAAANKGNGDAGVLGDAYFLATRAGWEDKEVSQWMHKAAALSDDDGPIWKITPQDFLDQMPEWNRQASEIWQMLTRGDIPMFLVDQGINKSLSDLMLFPSLANPLENDPRQRGAIPAYSGQREPLPLDINRQIGMDATALLTLSFLDLLDKALDAFDTIHIPHSTLGWLFDEKQRVAFHQPSRIRDAVQISHLLIKGALEKLSPSTVPNSDLSAQVGDELAQLIAEAEKVSGDDDTQRIVVRPSPVYRVASLMEKEADLTAHTSVLSSCQSIVDKLWEKGRITRSEKKEACAYLQLHEKPWTDQPKIDDGAILYLDDLAIAYFQHLGILEKLQAAGFKPIIFPRKVFETDQLISYKNISGEAKDTIERIRSAINLRIESEKIKVGRQINAAQTTDQSISHHPTFGVFSLEKGCDAIISDDRFLNQHPSIKNNNASMPVFSTLDLIDALVSTGAKTTEERLDYRTRLRRAGYIFVPVSKDELAHHLNASMIKDDEVVETAELKAIRENLLHVRMSNWLQLPKEAHWLVELQRTFVQVLKDQWKADPDFSIAWARSDWIMDQIDIQGWAHSYGTDIGSNIAKTGRSAFIMWLLTPPVEGPQQIKDKYWNWVEDRVLAPIKEQEPELYLELVEWHRRWIAETADMDLIEGRGNDE